MADNEHIVLFHIYTRPDLDAQAYQHAFERMMEVVQTIPGFLGIQGFAGEDGSELAVARFDSDEAIVAWREQPEHVETRRKGREEFFASYEITIAAVTRQYGWKQGEPVPAFS